MKKIKYLKIKQFLLSQNKLKTEILIIGHINYLNMFDTLKLKNYCEINNVSLLKIKNNLLKKLFKNNRFNNLLCGPTIFMYFNKVIELNNFFINNLINKKIFPLVVYWNNNFYDYNFFKKFYYTFNILNYKDTIHAFIKQIYIITCLKLKMFKNNNNLLINNIKNFIKK